mgnify:FL=1
MSMIYVHRIASSASLAALAASLVLASPAAAAESDQPKSSGVEDIVVTAQFRAQNLQSTPLAITAVSGDMLQARSQTSITDVAIQAPNVTLRPGFSQFGPSIAASIRGVGQYDFIPALEPGVGMYVDDVYYATLTGSIFDLLDLDRVEILRGPQGTLAGRNSIGGAIKLYSKRPSGDTGGFVQAAYGSRNRMDLRAAAEFNLAEGLDARIAGVAKKQQGYVKRLDFGCVNPAGQSPLNPAVGGVPNVLPLGGNCRLGRESDVDYNGIRGQLRYRPTSTLDINIIADYTNEDRTPTGSVLLSATTPPGSPIPGAPQVSGPVSFATPYDNRFVCGGYCNYGSFSNPADPGFGFSATRNLPQSRFKGWGISGQIDWDASDTLKLTSITAYRKYKATFTTDDDLSPLPVTGNRSDIDFHFFSQELRLNGSFADNTVEYTIGGFYSDQNSLYATSQDIRWAGIAFTSAPGNGLDGDRTPASSKALFAHAAWHVTDKLTFTGGIRYTKDKKEQTYTRRLIDGSGPHPFLGGLNGTVGKFSGDRVDYRANLSYQITDQVMVYGQLSTGFKGGGVNPRPFFASQAVPFGPETVTAYEAGFKGDFLDRAVRLNASAFFNKYKDIQLTMLSCPALNPPPLPPIDLGLPCAAPTNAGDADLKGAEVELSLRPAAGFMIDGSLSYIHFKYTSIDPLAASSGITPGMVAPFMSKWKWGIGAQYEIPLGDAGSLTPRIDAAYQSGIFSNAANAPTNRVKAYTIANARLTWRNADNDLEISAEVTNLFDKYYLLNKFDLFPAGLVTGVPGRPREWAVSMTKRF